MATVPGQLIWEIVKKNNSFLVKEFGNGTASTIFTKEPNNLYNLHSYKHSGLANKKTVTIQPAGKDQGVFLATTKTKKQNKPASLLNKSIMKKEFSRMAKAVQNQEGVNEHLRGRVTPFAAWSKVFEKTPGNRPMEDYTPKLQASTKGFEVADNYYRPDLKKAALARLSAVSKSLRVAKSGVKKRTRQARK